MSAIEYITPAAAMIGAVLGIANTWHLFRKERPKIKVMAVSARAHDDLQPYLLGVRVINKSSIPITIDSIGFSVADREERAGIINPIFLDDIKLPIRLEPRTSFEGFTNHYFIESDMMRFDRPFCSSNEGKYYFGSRRQSMFILSGFPEIPTRFFKYEGTHIIYNGQKKL